MRSAPAPTSGFVRLTCEDLPPATAVGMPTVLLRLTTSVELYQVLQPRGVVGTVAVQRGGTPPADGGSRNRLSNWPGSVHVDKLRQRTLQITTSLVTVPFNFFVGPRTIPQPGSRESRLVLVSLRGTSRRRENRAGLPADAGVVSGP